MLQPQLDGSQDVSTTAKTLRSMSRSGAAWNRDRESGFLERILYTSDLPNLSADPNPEVRRNLFIDKRAPPRAMLLHARKREGRS